MPAILSHHLFGRALLTRQNDPAFVTREARDAFLLGNQGPDPLFYATRTPSMVAIKKLGVSMHREYIEDYLKMWQEMLKRLRIKDYVYEVLQAYIYGFLSHYALDRALHPLVYAYQEALCTAGVSGLTPHDGSFVHGQIEADLDSYFLYKLTGRTIEEYHIPKQVLYSNEASLSSIDTLYRAASRLYHIKVPRGVFSKSVKDMRVLVQLLYSPGGTKRRCIGLAERLVRPHSLLQAMSHRPEAAYETWYTNEDNLLSLSTDLGTLSNKSAYERFVTALDTALLSIRYFKEGASLYEITKGLDFSGNSTTQKASKRQSSEHKAEEEHKA